MREVFRCIIWLQWHMRRFFFSICFRWRQKKLKVKRKAGLPYNVNKTYGQEHSGVEGEASVRAREWEAHVFMLKFSASTASVLLDVVQTIRECSSVEHWTTYLKFVIRINLIKLWNNIRTIVVNSFVSCCCWVIQITKSSQLIKLSRDLLRAVTVIPLYNHFTRVSTPWNRKIHQQSLYYRILISNLC